VSPFGSNGASRHIFDTIKDEIFDMSELNRLDAQLNIGTYLAELLQTIGLEHYFTVPGDYNLVLLDQMLKNSICR
jgi:hypothetical protein